jgi:hypothetical protein
MEKEEILNSIYGKGTDWIDATKRERNGDP